MNDKNFVIPILFLIVAAILYSPVVLAVEVVDFKSIRQIGDDNKMIRSIIIDYRNDSALFGTESGLRIYKNSNEKWEKLISLNYQNDLPASHLLIDPFESNSIYYLEGDVIKRVMIDGSTIKNDRWFYVSHPRICNGIDRGRAAWMITKSFAIGSENPLSIYAGQGYYMSGGGCGEMYGVWKLTDQNESWTALRNGIDPNEHPEIISLAINKNNPDVILAGYYGYQNQSGIIRTIGGVYKSVDGGVNWTKTFNKPIHKIKIHPTNTEMALLASSVGLFKSKDGGSTWQEIWPYATSDVEFDQVDHDIIYAKPVEELWGPLIASTDNGYSWSKIKNWSVDKIITALAVNPNDLGGLYIGTMRHDVFGVYAYDAFKLKLSFDQADEKIRFFASVQNSSVNWLNLRQTPGIQNKLTNDIIKTLPNGWAIKVINITNENSDYVDIDGYRWYKVEDVTDGAIGWLPAKNLSDGTIYLNYDADSQGNLQNKAETQLSNSSDRKLTILEAVNNYFFKNNYDNSLYGGGGGLDGRNNFQTFIRGSNFPKELILSITTQESGPEFNNEICSWAKDGGIGVMQITSAWFKGLGSGLNNVAHKDDCDASWVGNISKYYSNAPQGIYANIKDGFRVLQNKYRQKCPQSSIFVDGYEFICQDIERILTTWGYNGFAKDRDTGLYSGHYLKYVANKLRNIGAYFNGIFYANSDNFIEKLEVADSNKQVIKLYSPATFHVVDEQGRVTGLLGNTILEEIPNSLYERDAESAVIFFPTKSYRYRVVGNTDGAYSFSVDFTDRGVLKTFKASDIYIVAGGVHEYIIDWDALSAGEIGTTINIDYNSDGVTDRVFVSGDTFSQTDIFLQDNADVDIDPDTINLQGNGKFITAYIELPGGFEIDDIVTHSIRLNQVASSVEQPITINDYDKDGVPDLMVKFRREDIMPSLVVNNSSAEIFVVGKIMWNDRINYWGGRDVVKIIR